MKAEAPALVALLEATPVQDQPRAQALRLLARYLLLSLCISFCLSVSLLLYISQSVCRCISVCESFVCSMHGT